MCTVIQWKRTGDNSWQGDRRTLGEDGRDGQDATPADTGGTMCSGRPDIAMALQRCPQLEAPALRLAGRSHPYLCERGSGFPTYPPNPASRVSAFHAAVPIEEFRRTGSHPGDFGHLGADAAYPLKQIEDVARDTLRDAIIMGDRHAAEVSRAIVLLLDEVKPPNGHDRAVALRTER